jgi:hypothetical protein
MQRSLFGPLACVPLLACAAAAQGAAVGQETAACRPAPLLAPGSIAPYSAAPADAWTDLFDQTSGWTGADGVYSIPLSGDERACAGHLTQTFFTFSDTFIGDVDGHGHRLPGTTMVNNTQALLAGGQPEKDALGFFWKTDALGKPTAMVDADTAAEEYFWPQDGLVVGGELVLFAMRMGPADTAFGFELRGVSQLAWKVGPGMPFATYTQSATPLQDGVDSYGRAVLANTAAARAPFPDGYVYVYGLRELPFDKQMLVARVAPGELGDFSAYRFWDGAAWSPDLHAAAPLVHRMSSEYSVSPLSDGRFLVTYQQDDFLGQDITVRLAASPVGPFGAAVPIYTIPEPGLLPDVYAYGAKAHPHLSRPDRLLVSYHVNTFNFADHFEYADIYRPRFVELPLTP